MCGSIRAHVNEHIFSAFPPTPNDILAAFVTDFLHGRLHNVIVGISCVERHHDGSPTVPLLELLSDNFQARVNVGCPRKMAVKRTIRIAVVDARLNVLRSQRPIPRVRILHNLHGRVEVNKPVIGYVAVFNRLIVRRRVDEIFLPLISIQFHA